MNKFKHEIHFKIEPVNRKILELEVLQETTIKQLKDFIEEYRINNNGKCLLINVATLLKCVEIMYKKIKEMSDK